MLIKWDSDLCNLLTLNGIHSFETPKFSLAHSLASRPQPSAGYKVFYGQLSVETLGYMQNV